MIPNDVAVRAEQLSKQYRLAPGVPRVDTLREHLTAAMAALRRGRLFGRRPPTPFRALENASFTVNRGEVVGILGRNGAGKSTLLKILARVTEPTSGRCELRGRVGSLLEVGTGFHPDLTGRENVYFAGALLGMRRDEVARKFDEIVAFAEVDRFVDTPVKRYSSGMYVRLGFAVAAHLEPEILLVDEVLAVGDFAFQRKCLGRMRNHATAGRTVLFVSHNLSAVRQLCGRCLRLEGGRIVADGPADQIVDGYLESMRASTASPSHANHVSADDDATGFLIHVPRGREMLVTCGGSIQLAFDVEAPTAPIDRDLAIAVTIDGSGGTPMVNMRSHVADVQTGVSAARRWRVSCDLGRLPLNAGSYYASIYLVDTRKTIATFSQAIHIRVLDHEEFGWGASLPGSRYWGPFYWTPTWRIAAADTADGPVSEGESCATT
jgi:lipopolysaccharide transport system ATP-binding protein